MAISIDDLLMNACHLATNLFGTERICERARRHHSHILEQVKAGEADGARKVMEEHLAFSRSVLSLLESDIEEVTIAASPGTDRQAQD
jgi:DNA-binding FadR family transcriptional regulator